MIELLAEPAPSFTSKDALGPLLSSESLLFGLLNVALGLASQTTYGKKLTIEPRTLAHWAAGLVTLIALGAAAAWVDLFVLGDFPDGGGIPPVVLLALGILVQPVFAWIIARNVDPPPTPLE